MMGYHALLQELNAGWCVERQDGDGFIRISASSQDRYFIGSLVGNHEELS